MTQSRGPWLSTATALFLSWSFLSLLVRVWVKFGKRHGWGLDDSAISAAFFVALIHVSTTFWAINRGYGLPLASITESNRDELQKTLYASDIFYLLSVGLTKISTALFIRRLTRNPLQVRLAYILAAVSGVWTTASIVVIALRGNLSRPWATLDGSEALFVRWTAIEAVGLVIEAALWILSIDLIWILKMKLSKRLLILGVFGCRLLLIPIVATRLVYLSPSRNTDPTYTSILASILTEASLEYCLVSASITSLRPFLRPFHSGTMEYSTTGPKYGSKGRTGSKSQERYMLSSIQTNDKDRTFQTAERSRGPSIGSRNGDIPQANGESNLQTLFRPNQIEQHTIISARGDPLRDDPESVESEGSDQMIIRETKDWSVRYEDR